MIRLKSILTEQAPGLTAVEQTLLGFLNDVLSRGLDSGTSMDRAITQNAWNKQDAYPMAKSLLEKRKTGKVTYDVNKFKAFVEAMRKQFDTTQLQAFYKSGATITNIQFN